MQILIDGRTIVVTREDGAQATLTLTDEGIETSVDQLRVSVDADLTLTLTVPFESVNA